MLGITNATNKNNTFFKNKNIMILKFMDISCTNKFVIDTSWMEQRESRTRP